MPAFDPYQQWLGIAPSEQPPDYYRLLGLPRFESDASAIQAAAKQRSEHIQMFASGGHERDAKTIQNEIAAAQLCLLDPQAKQDYDAALRTLLATGQKPGAAAQPSAVQEAVAPEDAGEAPPPFYLQPWFPLTLLVVVLLLATSLGVVWWLRSSPGAPATPPVAADNPAPIASDPPAVVEVQYQPVEQNNVGVVTLTPSQAELSGGLTLTTVGGELVIGNWASEEGAAKWRVRIDDGVFHTVQVIYAAQDEGKFRLETPKTGKTRSVKPSAVGDFNTDEFLIRLDPGRVHELTLRTQELGGAELMELKSIILTKSNRY